MSSFSAEDLKAAERLMVKFEDIATEYDMPGDQVKFRAAVVALRDYRERMEDSNE